MRDLLNLLQTLNEEAKKATPKTLTPAEILKRPGRYEAFINHIASGKDIKTVDGKLVKIDPSEAERIEALHNSPGGTKFTGSIMLKIDGSNMSIPLSSILKTKEFGGQKEGSANDDEESDEEAVANSAKAAFGFNPANIKITDREISADQLGDLITSNAKLNASAPGKIVVLLAQEIMAGEGAILPEDIRGSAHKTLRSALTDDAGEYLGVLALLYRQSEFPKRKQFEEWLGGSIEDLVLRFPSKQNERLADSYAEIKNPETMHEVKISSKGSGGGAPPAMSGLKIPDDMRRNKRFAALIEFIDMCVETPTKEQPFKAMNILYKHNPSAIPKKFNKFLPWTDRDYDMAENSLQLFKKNQKEESRLPEKYRAVWADTVFKGDSSDGGRLMYMTKKAVMDSINMNDAIPNFEGGVMNILDMNFVQQYAEYKGGKIRFMTQWPAKLDGVVTIESKSGATDPTKGGFSFKLAPKAGEFTGDVEGAEGELGAETGDDLAAQTVAQSDKSFNAAASKLTGGPDFSTPKPSADGVGREKRKR
jgi:hypothetical protein